MLTKGGKTIDELAAVPVIAQQPRRSRGKQRGRTKTPAGTRLVDLPPSIAAFYELLLASQSHLFTFTTQEGQPLRRSNFRQRHWRPTWDGTDPDYPMSPDHQPAILPWFTFHEGRHTHSTWLIEDGVPEVARRGRLGQKMKGIARTYAHITPEMRLQVLTALEARWQAGLTGLTATEQAKLVSWFPHLAAHSAAPEPTIDLQRITANAENPLSLIARKGL